MEIHGSSRILDLTGISPLTGPDGPIGTGGVYAPMGPTGPTGEQGVLGFTGYGITYALGTGGDGITYQIIFSLDGFIGSTYGYLSGMGATMGVTGVRGGTGETSSTNFIIKNAVEGAYYGELFKNQFGMTAYFRNITVSGRDITIGLTGDNTIILRGATFEDGKARMGNTGELLFISGLGLSASGALNTYWSGNEPAPELKAKIITHKEIKANNNNLPVNNVDPINTSNVVSASNIDGTLVTFSSIFEDADPLSGVTAMVSGFHLGDDAGTDVIYRFDEISISSKYSVSSIQNQINIGSCCYCADQETLPDHRDCIDYVTKNYCDAMSGVFSYDVCLNRSEGPNCYLEGACCVNGICVETSEEKCRTYGGFYVKGFSCEDDGNIAGLDGLDGCPSACEERGSCCINFECYDMTEYECSFSPNGIFIDNPCSETDCCTEGTMGACCLDEVCYHATPDICSTLVSSSGSGQSSGVFWGVGSKCAGLQLVDPVQYNEASYYPFNCDVGGNIVGQLDESGLCSDGTPPPCTECLGWQQIMPTAPDAVCGSGNYHCLCEDVDCACRPPDYSCVDSDSCGTIKLVSGECWECCKNQPGSMESYGACCMEDGEGDYTCLPYTKANCEQLGGVFASGSCDKMNCTYGACCYDYGCDLQSAEDCIDNSGIWVGNATCTTGTCNDALFSEKSTEVQSNNLMTLLTKSPKKRKEIRTKKIIKNIKNRIRKLTTKPNTQCDGSSNIPSCIEPGIVYSPSKKHSWIIESGSGECSCCCPGVCYSGAVGDGGLVQSCKDIDEKCFQILNSFDGGCNSSTPYNISSILDDILPVCNNKEQWTPNIHGCVPYIDESDPKNPIWMVCSCCCEEGNCTEYKNPIPCTECQSRGKKGQCVCVNSCENCFS